MVDGGLQFCWQIDGGFEEGLDNLHQIRKPAPAKKSKTIMRSNISSFGKKKDNSGSRF